MTDDLKPSATAFDEKNLANFYVATVLFFKRRLSSTEGLGGCGIAGLEASESSGAEWEAMVKAYPR